MPTITELEESADPVVGGAEKWMGRGCAQCVRPPSWPCSPSRSWRRAWTWWWVGRENGWGGAVRSVCVPHHGHARHHGAGGERGPGGGGGGVGGGRAQCVRPPSWPCPPPVLGRVVNPVVHGWCCWPSESQGGGQASVRQAPGVEWCEAGCAVCSRSQRGCGPHFHLTPLSQEKKTRSSTHHCRESQWPYNAARTQIS